MQKKQKQFLDPNQVLHYFKLSNLPLDMTLRKLKQRIDTQFQQFRSTLMSMLNNLNFLRYMQTYPADDIKFIFKEKVNASVVEARLEQKQQIMGRMMSFDTIKQDHAGISSNCSFQVEKIMKSKQNIINIKNICPSACSFIERYEDKLAPLLPFWKNNEDNVISLGQLFRDISPVFPKQQLRKLKSIMSRTNKNLVSAKLLFRASQHNFQSALFKEVCVGHGHTLLLAKSDKGNIFGGYTPAKWLNTKQKQFVGDPTASSFLFSLDHNMAFPIKRNQLDYAISAYGGWGPIYGSPYGPDLSISDKCHLNDNSCSSLGSHYDIPVNVKEFSQQAFALLAGAKKFKVVEYEVYELVLE